MSSGNGSATNRPFDLKAGDMIVCGTHQGYLGVHHEDGSRVDLNQLIMDSGSTRSCISATKTMSIAQVQQIAACLAVSYGLCSSTALIGWAGYILCPIINPDEESPHKPSAEVEEFLEEESSDASRV